MGLRSGGEKPATVLWLVYTIGWLPALICAYALRTPPGAVSGLTGPGAAGPVFGLTGLGAAGGVFGLPGLGGAGAFSALSSPGGTGSVAVLTGAGQTGVVAGFALGVSLAILTAAYLVAIRHPPSQRVLLAAAAGSVLAALAMPLLFSADIYAYAYYGDLALHGRAPYGHGPAPSFDPLAAAAVAAWNGHVPPRCVYGPVAVAIAALADIAGRGGGVAVQMFLQRLAAAAAYAAYVGLVLRLVYDARSRAAFVLNPVVIWSVAEGHNDAAMVAFVLAGLALPRGRPFPVALYLALGALVKAPAILAFSRIPGKQAALLASGLVAVGYLPLGSAVAAGLGPRPLSLWAPGSAAVWQSPLGLAAALIGSLPAIGIAVALLGAVGLAVQRLPVAERTPAFALAAWFALPNAYPWYALWTVPLAARNTSSLWSRALLVAAAFSPARAITDAVFRAPQSVDAAPSFHAAMIALEFLPPLCFLATAFFRRRSALALLIVGAVFAWPAVAAAQSSAFGPQPVVTATPGPRPPVATTTSGPPPAGPTPTPNATSATPSPQPAGPTGTPGSGTPSAAPGSGTASATPGSGAAPATPGPVVAPATLAPAIPTSSPMGNVPVPQPQLAPPTPPQPSSSPAPSPTPSAAAAPPPRATAIAAPPTTAAPQPSIATAVPAANPFGFIINPPPVATTNPDGPHIIQVELNDRRIHAGGPLLVRVFTSANVVGVEARAMGRFIPIPQSSPGLFALAYTMPSGVPFWLLNRNYDIVIAAATADGRQTSVSFQMLFTR